MSEFTLADIKAAAEAKFGATTIALSETESVELVNAIRLPKEKRKQLTEIQSKISSKEEGAEDRDIVDLFEALIRLVAKTPAEGEKLVEACEHDAAYLNEAVSRWAKGTQVGEASPSES